MSQESKDVLKWRWNLDNGKSKNLMCRDHLTSNEKYRDGWDRIFGKKDEGKKE